MIDTGERCLTEGISRGQIEHLHRYGFAMQFVENKTVVDIASGEGYGSNIMASIAANVIGIDISEDVIKHAQEKYIKNNLSFKIGSATNIPLENNSIDVVVSFETIEHHDKHQEMIEEIKRILKPEGIVIISSPDKLNYSDMPRISNKFHVKELYFEEFKNLIETNFKYSIFLNQKVTYSSLIVPKESMNFYEFFGDFNKIEKNMGIKNPVYNITIASQRKIENVFSSSFEADKVLKQLLDGNTEYYKKMYIEILNSKTYRLGKFIATPFSTVRNLIKHLI